MIVLPLLVAIGALFAIGLIVNLCAYLHVRCYPLDESDSSAADSDSSSRDSDYDADSDSDDRICDYYRSNMPRRYSL